MSFPFPTKEVHEGKARILVPDVPRRLGPGKREGVPFYNPTSSISRDLSVFFARKRLRNDDVVLDGLTGTGVWGIRMALESGREPEIRLNDRNSQCVALAEANCKENDLSLSISRDDLRAHLTVHHYDYVDVDPFGSPVPFVSALLQSMRAGTLISVTATDTAPLCGAVPESCWRRYSARAGGTQVSGEVGLRILMGFLVREAARFEKGLKPLLCYRTGHMFRVHAEVLDGARRAHECLSEMGYVDVRGSLFTIGPNQTSAAALGPLWTGVLVDKELFRDLFLPKYLGTQSTKLLHLLAEEAGMPPLFYATDVMSSELRLDPVPLLELLGTLRRRGYSASRTHFSPYGAKTDAPYGVVIEIYKELSDSRTR